MTIIFIDHFYRNNHRKFPSSVVKQIGIRILIRMNFFGKSLRFGFNLNESKLFPAISNYYLWLKFS